ncbi:IclR family transcriptional regulator [Nocardia sp. NBC_01329]|uniref:IclR family transcriptional regulator n=1 Tax=Nocardia sp. NBC_01329 TaxID=2903594 RepID=UPI002E0E7003|nr:IclR family transcriptional regulator [Nocardia sp. NBC_01329]
MTIIDSRPGATEEVRKPELPPSMVERMTRILDAFDGRAARLSLEEVACRAQLPRSTVYRILHQLTQSSWVEHTSLGYALGRRALGLGGSDGHDRIRAVAAPLLHDLHLRTGLVVHLTVRDGGESLYLDKVGGRFAAHLPSRVGGRAPAYATAGGKAILAYLEPESVDRLYDRALRRRTGNTIGELATLHRELGRIRLRGGLAFDDGESVPGVACAGAAVRGPNGPVAAVSVCGDARTAQLDRVAPLVANLSREVSRSLYPEPPDRPAEDRRDARRLEVLGTG